MSYDIYFVKGDKLDAQKVNELLESELSESDENFISKGQKIEVKEAFSDNGLSFEIFEGQEDDYLELNLETYQICIFNSQISVSIPYWDENSSDAIGNEIRLISQVLIERGFTGFDPQTGRLITEPTELSTDLSEGIKRTKSNFVLEVGVGKKSEAWRLIKLGTFFVFVFLLLKLLASLSSQLF